MSSASLQILEVAAWGAAGGLWAGIYPLIGERGLPRSERVAKDRFWFLVSFILLPVVGLGFAFLARSKCGQIDAVFTTFVGFAAPSLLQKWSKDSLNL